MLFLLDTNAVSDVMENHPKVVARLRGLAPNDRAVISPIVRGEILFGIERWPIGKRRADLLHNAENIFNDLACESLNSGVADAYSSLKRSCQLAGTPLADNDLWIAASAIVLNAAVITRDADLGRVAGLTVQDWSI